MGRLGPWLVMAGAVLCIYLVAFTIPFFLGNHYAIPQLQWASMAGYRLEVALAYTAVIIALFALYYFGYRALAHNSSVSPWAIYLPPVTFALALLAIYPADGWDLFVYISQGRTLSVYNLNPFLVSPQEAPQDVFYNYSSWVSHVSIYGPVWVVISSLTAYLLGENIWLNVVVFKLVTTVFMFAAVTLIYLTTCRLNPGQRHLGSYLFLWNPLVLFEISGNGHNDIVMVFFALLSFYLLVERRSMLALPSVALSALVKYASGLILPGLILYQVCTKPRSKQSFLLLLGGLVLMTATAYLFARPFQAAFSPSALLGQGESFRSSLAGLLFLSLTGSFGQQDAANISKVAAASSFVLAYGGLIAWYLKQRPTSALESLLKFSYYSIFFLLVFIPRFLPWYVIWLLGIAFLMPDSPLARRACLLSFTAFLSHIIFYFVWGIYGERINYFTIEAMASTFIFTPPLVHWYYCRRRERIWSLAEKDRTIAFQEAEISRLRLQLANTPKSPKPK